MDIINSNVSISMKNGNDLGCSLAIVSKEIGKERKGVLIIWKDLEIGVFDYYDMKSVPRYILLKQYFNLEYAKKDFFKLIGKMCKKRTNGTEKYFLQHKIEDNRIIFFDFLNEVGIQKYLEDKKELDVRKEQFLYYIQKHLQEFSMVQQLCK